MKVCMVAYTNYENDNRVMRYAEALVQRGDEVDVLALHRDDDQGRRETLRGVNVYRIQRRVVNERGPLSYLFKILAFFMRAFLFLSVMQVKKRYDVVHVHSMPDFLVFTALVPKLLGARVILDIHDVLPEFYADKFNIRPTSLAFKGLVAEEWVSAVFADHVIIANDIWGDRLTKRSVRKSKCSVFLNYPDPSIFKRQNGKLHDDRFVMMYPGTLSPHQGLDIAIRAIPKILDEAPNVELHIYGCGSHHDALCELTEELGLGEIVKFEEFVPISEVAKVMSRATIGVVPKRADSFGNEAFSTKILEFMAVGVPVLAAETAVDRYYFDDSQIQFFESGNPDDLARSVVELIRDPARLKGIAEAGSECVKEYCWDAHRQRYFDLVDARSNGA